MSITLEFLEIAAWIVAIMAFLLWVGFVFGKAARPDDHTAEDDAEQAEYLRAANAEFEKRRRVKAYPITESKS